jgi:hypothetical protein
MKQHTLRFEYAAFARELWPARGSSPARGVRVPVGKFCVRQSCDISGVSGLSWEGGGGGGLPLLGIRSLCSARMYPMRISPVTHYVFARTEHLRWPLTSLLVQPHVARHHPEAAAAALAAAAAAALAAAAAAFAVGHIIPGSAGSARCRRRRRDYRLPRNSRRGRQKEVA